MEKAEYIETCLDILASKQSIDPDEYISDYELKDVVERRFVKMTQACIDIARMILKDLGSNVPSANSDTMRQLASEDVVNPATGQSMATACGLRNVLAHKYGTIIDDGMVYDALQDLSRYRNFLDDIREFLAEEGAI